MAFGKQLQEARKKRHLTASQVASATNIKIQIIEDLESEDLRRIPAAIYGKGFIKLYAEYVGLAPQPLLDDFTALIRGNAAPEPAPILTEAVQHGLVAESARVAAGPREPPAGPADPPPRGHDLFAYGEKRQTEHAVHRGVYADEPGGHAGEDSAWQRIADALAELADRFRTSRVWQAAAGGALLVIVVVVVTLVAARRNRPQPPPDPLAAVEAPIPGPAPAAATPSPPAAPANGALRLAEEPGPAWFD